MKVIYTPKIHLLDSEKGYYTCGNKNITAFSKEYDFKGSFKSDGCTFGHIIDNVGKRYPAAIGSESYNNKERIKQYNELKNEFSTIQSN